MLFRSELLWACDVNFVRGEDSFVRAHWAARPMVWQIYPQDDHAHRVKLDAFLGRYLGDPDDGTFPASELVRLFAAFVRAWNGFGNFPEHVWADLTGAQGLITPHARRWADSLAEHIDLASNLCNFCMERFV